MKGKILTLHEIKFIEGRLDYLLDKVNAASINFDWEYYDKEVNELEWLLRNLVYIKMTREQFVRLKKSLKKIQEIQLQHNLFMCNCRFEVEDPLYSFLP